MSYYFFTSQNDNLANKILFKSFTIAHTAQYKHTDVNLTGVLPANKNYRAISINTNLASALQGVRPIAYSVLDVVTSTSTFWIRTVTDSAYTGNIDVMVVFAEV